MPARVCLLAHEVKNRRFSTSQGFTIRTFVSAANSGLRCLPEYRHIKHFIYMLWIVSVGSYILHNIPFSQVFRNNMMKLFFFLCVDTGIHLVPCWAKESRLCDLSVIWASPLPTSVSHTCNEMLAGEADFMDLPNTLPRKSNFLQQGKGYSWNIYRVKIKLEKNPNDIWILLSPSFPWYIKCNVSILWGQPDISIERIHPIALPSIESHTPLFFWISDQTLLWIAQHNGSFSINYRLWKGTIHREKQHFGTKSKRQSRCRGKKYDECLLINQVYTLNEPGSSMHPSPSLISTTAFRVRTKVKCATLQPDGSPAGLWPGRGSRSILLSPQITADASHLSAC